MFHGCNYSEYHTQCMPYNNNIFSAILIDESSFFNFNADLNLSLQSGVHPLPFIFAKLNEYFPTFFGGDLMLGNDKF